MREFEAKWLPAGTPARASALGTGDVQSLADLANSYATQRATRSFPVTRDAIVALAAATLAPLAPLLLTVVPAEELATRLLKLIL